MKHHTEPDGTLVVTIDSRFIVGMLTGAALLCAVPIFRSWLNGGTTPHDATPLIGSAMFLIGAFFSYERNRFAFDPHLKEVRWSRRSLMAKDEGRMPFSCLRSLTVQTAIGSTKTTPLVRLALVTDERDIPLSMAYAGGMRREYEELAIRIRRVMQMNAEPTDLLLDSLRAALAQGRKLDAIKLVRMTKDVTLEEAQQFVEQLAVSPTAGSRSNYSPPSS